PHKQMAFLRGWMEGDGYRSDNGRHIIVTTCKDMAVQAGMMLARNGIAYSIRKDHKGNNPKHKTQYRVGFFESGNREAKNILVDDDYIYRRVISNTSEYFNGDVYNLEVRDANSYVVDVIAVHNSVNRNQPRKGIPSLIAAFKMFKDGYVICNNCGAYRNLEV